MSKVLFVDDICVHLYGHDIPDEEATAYARHVIAEHSGKGIILAIHIQVRGSSVAISYDLRTNPIFKYRK